MKSIKELRKNNKKGFTLVELIVVLVILAILAALLIPTLTGYIDRAKEKDVIAKTRQTVMATQTLVDEAYAKVDVNTQVYVEGMTIPAGTTAAVTKAQIASLAEVTEANIGAIAVSNDGKVNSLVYTEKGKTCTYTRSTNTYDVTSKN